MHFHNISIFSVLFFFISSSNALGDEQIPSYSSELKVFMEEQTKAKDPFSAEDRAVMAKAGESLARKMPQPGLPAGQKAPAFILQDAFGNKVSLYEELKQGPVILVFYRGAWCPFCNLHLHILHRSQDAFKKYNAQMIAITPQLPDKSAEQINKDAYSFKVLSDLDSTVMKAYKLYFELDDDLIHVYKKHGLDIEAYNGEGRNALPVPGTFVIDQSGIIRASFADTDYTKRVEPTEIVQALKDLSK